MSDARRPPAEAARSLGAAALFVLAFGAIVGVSWIVLVGEWLRLSGPVGAALAFALGGLVVLVVGYSYAELGSAYPRTGGELVYAREIYGDGAAHAIACVLLLLYLSLVAFEAVSISWVLAAMFPAFLGPPLYTVQGATMHLGGVLAGVVASLLIAWINWHGAQSAGRLQHALTVAKIAVALVFVAFGIAAADTANLVPAFGPSTGADAVAAFLLLLSSTPLFFAGFGVVTQAMGEARPEQYARLGRVLLAVVAASVAFYGLVIVVVAGLVPSAELARYELPAAHAFEAAFGSRAIANGVLAVGLLGLLTVWNAVFFAAVRVLEGMAQQGLVRARWLERSDPARSPVGAVLLVLLVSFAGLAIGRSLLLPIVSVGGLAVTVLFLFVCVACRARRARTTAPAPFTVRGGGALIWAGIALSSALVIASFYGLFASASGVPGEVLVIGAWAIVGVLLRWHALRRADRAARGDRAKEAA